MGNSLTKNRAGGRTIELFLYSQKEESGGDDDFADDVKMSTR